MILHALGKHLKPSYFSNMLILAIIASGGWIAKIKWR